MAELNQWEADNARQSANDNAQNAYNQGMLQLGNAQLAFQKAQQVWKETMDKAGLTGTYEGMPTQAALQFGATQFGTWGAPQQGDETLASKQQTYQQQYDTAGQFGQYLGPGGPQQGQQTLTGAEQGFTQGLRTQQEQRAAQAQQQAQAQQYLQLLSSLRGPADWVKYQQVLGATPGGMRDLVGAAMGQYVPGGGATTGVAPQAVSLQSLMGDVTGQAYQGQGGGQLGMPDVYAQNNAAMYSQQPPQSPQQYTNQYQYPQQAQQAQAQAMQAAGYPATGVTPEQAAQFTPEQRAQYEAATRQAYQAQQQAVQPSTQTQAMLQGQLNPQAYAQQATRPQEYNPQNNQAVNAMGGGTNTMGAPAQNQYQQAMNTQLPAPNQIAPQSWNNLAPSQKEMLMGQYEAQGWHKPDVEALRNQALPKYAANAPTAGTFKLR